MYEEFLAVCRHDENWARVFAYAQSLAPSSGARVTALVRKMSDAAIVDVGTPIRVVRCHTALAESIGFHAAWADAVLIDALVAEADLESIVCDGGRPCIVLPRGIQTPPAPRRIAVGWNGSLESMRALKSALPLLRRAEHVVVFDAGRNPHEMCDAPPSAVTYLADHGIVAARARSETGAGLGCRLAELAAEHSADLLVLGAYRHQRFSEWDSGAAIEQALRIIDIPVLLRH
ncbi:MAG TPA: universal stress protein [Tahibacter sp.]|nr:universal stress protein [Tahibacter sp.]